MFETLEKSISKLAEKAIEKTGVMTALITIIVFGISSLIGTLYQAFSVTAISFGIAGALEVFHNNRKSNIYHRSQPLYDKDTLFNGFMSHKTKLFHPKVFEEFSYCDMRFKIMGFHEVPFPITVTKPLCPKCGGNLVESVTVNFPGKIRIEFNCLCGYSVISKKTLNELIYEISEFKNLPADSSKASARHK